VLDTPIRDRQAERREATRLEILDAAWAIAREHGLSQVTLRDVAAGVGMRAPSLYTHFESKHAIYDAMFAQAWTECEQAMAAAERQPAQRTTLYADAPADRVEVSFAAAPLEPTPVPPYDDAGLERPRRLVRPGLVGVS